MSDYIKAIIAAGIQLGFNDGANKGFWRIQPRIRGRWVEMGAEIRAALKVNGQVTSVLGRAVGSTGTSDGIRFMVRGLTDQGIPDGIYPISVRHAQLIGASLPEGFLKKKGIARFSDIDFDSILNDPSVPSVEDLERADITEDDIRLVNEGIESSEGKELSKFKNTEEGKKVAAQRDAEDEEYFEKLNKSSAAKSKKKALKDVVDETVADAIDGKDIGSLDSLLEKASNEVAAPEGDPNLTQRTPKTTTRSYVEELAEGDYIDDPFAKTNDYVRVVDNGEFNESQTAIDFTVEDKNGNQRTLSLPRGSRVDRITEFRDNEPAQPEEAPTSEAAPTPEAAPEPEPEPEAIPEPEPAATPEAAAPEKKKYKLFGEKPPAGTQRYFADEIERGRVLRDADGNELGTVLGDAEKFTTPQGVKGYRFNVFTPEGEIESIAVRQDIMNQQGVFLDKAKSKNARNLPQNPAAAPKPKATPSTVEAPAPAPEAEAPEVPATTPETPVEKANVPEAEQPTAAPDKTPAEGSQGTRTRRKKTKEEIEALRKTKVSDLVDGNGVPYKDQNDPNALMSFLKEEAYPDAEDLGNGQWSLIEDVSTEGGKNVLWQIRAALSPQKKVVYSIYTKDLDSGQENEEFHIDDRDSIQSTLGLTNGPETLADLIQGLYTPKTKGADTTKAKNIFDRLKYLQYNTKTKTVADWALFYANGRAQRVDRKTLRQLEKEVPTLWDPYLLGITEEGSGRDYGAIRDRLKLIFGKIPANKELRSQAIQALNKEFASVFPDANVTNLRTFSALVASAASAVTRADFDNPDIRQIPYSSADRVRIVKEGDVVEYQNNVGGKSVARVVGRKRVSSADPSQSKDSFGYTDYVYIAGANGEIAEIPSTNLTILDDQEFELTDLDRRVSGLDFKRRRVSQIAELEAERIKVRDTYLKYRGLDNKDGENIPENMTPGSTVFDDDGDALGTVESVKSVNIDGKTVYSVVYVDQDGVLKSTIVEL